MLFRSNTHARSDSLSNPPTLSSQRRGSEGPHEAEAEASSQTEGSPSAVASIELSPVGSPNQDLTFTEVHTQLAPELEDVGNALEREEPGAAESNGVPESEEIPESDIPKEELLVREEVREEVSEAYALSATLPQEDSLSAPPCNQEEEEEETEEGQNEKEIVVEQEEEEKTEVELKEVEQKEEKEKESPVEEAHPERITS